jgi:hypothetical protein
MELKINKEILVKNSLDPNSIFLLFLLYHKQFGSIKEVYGVLNAISIRNKLVGTPYILSDESVAFTSTILSNSHVEKLFDIRGDKINFWEFYNCYPIKVENRVLRAAGPNSQLALKHQKKYLSKVKTLDQHKLAIKAIEAFVSKQKASGSLRYLPAMETVMNNASWENWGVFIDKFGEEGKEWNMDKI